MNIESSTTVLDIATFLNAQVTGDTDQIIDGVTSLLPSAINKISFVTDQKNTDDISNSEASCILVPLDFDLPVDDKVLIKVKNPSIAINNIIKEFFYDIDYSSVGVSKNAHIGKDVKLGKNVSIDNFVVIDDNAIIEDEVIIRSGVFIGKNSYIGENTLIHPNVTIMEQVKIGKRVCIHSGTVIGSDGFGFLPGKNGLEKIFQIGTVEIEDDVEIQANVTIDRARFDKTIIKKGCKIDNLVHIAHNVKVGENSMLLAQSGIAGSTTLGKNVIMAGQSGATGHLNIGNNVTIASKSAVTKKTGDNKILSGFPAVDHLLFKKRMISFKKLPDALKKIEKLEKQLNVLMQKISKDNK